MGGVNDNAYLAAKPGRCKVCRKSGQVNPRVRKTWDGVCADCKKKEEGK